MKVVRLEKAFRRVEECVEESHLSRSRLWSAKRSSSEARRGSQPRQCCSRMHPTIGTFGATSCSHSDSARGSSRSGKRGLSPGKIGGSRSPEGRIPVPETSGNNVHPLSDFVGPECPDSSNARRRAGVVRLVDTLRDVLEFGTRNEILEMTSRVVDGAAKLAKFTTMATT